MIYNKQFKYFLSNYYITTGKRFKKIKMATTITLSDIEIQRELIGSVWAKMNGITNPSFAHMNLIKTSDVPEVYDFDIWIVPDCPKPTLADMLSITVAQLDTEIALYT
jgi:hypothetical protein